MPKKVDYEYYFKCLLAMNQRGVYLTGMDGHTWIMNDPDAEYGGWDETLRKKGVMLNSKIYGGALEAIVTFDEAIKLAGENPLDECWITELGDGGYDTSRVDKVPDGQGGIN